VIEDGRVAQAGTPDELRRHPATAYAAAVAGTNLLFGHNDGGTITIEPPPGPGAGPSETTVLHTADSGTGPVQVVVDPRAVSLHPDRPRGSHRNVWPTTVQWIEPLGETTRIMLDAPLPLVVDITPSAATALGLAPGSAIWAALKATEVATTPRP
ncbi:MAG: TOBE domain-containing protein, partial [Actinomycetota bacterium]